MSQATSIKTLMRHNPTLTLTGRLLSPLLQAWLLTGSRRTALLNAYNAGLAGNIPNYEDARKVSHSNLRRAYLKGVADNGLADGATEVMTVTQKEYWQVRDREAVDTYLEANKQGGSQHTVRPQTLTSLSF